MRFQHVSAGGLATSAVAVNLYVSSYSGIVTSLQLAPSAQGPGIGGYVLTTTASNNGSGPQPSWLTKDSYNDVIYCVDEAFSTPNGTVTAYTTSKSGPLTLIDSQPTVIGPVSTVVYNDGKALAAAHYSGSAATSWTILPSGGLKALQAFIFNLTTPGPNTDRQEAPHPHEVILDPTGSFIIIPDLGADLLRVFSIDPKTSLLTESTPFSAPAGSGLRHGTFLKTESGKTFFFLVSELANTIASYEVTYIGTTGMNFTNVFLSGIYGNRTMPDGAAAAEAVLSPDKKFLLTSSRNATFFNLTNFDKTNSTKIPSDTLQSWAIDHATGELSLKQIAPAGGSFPRQFSVNKAGDLVAVGLQMDGRVVVIERNVVDGTLGDFVANVDVAGQVTSVIWDE
ncbi:3-carboxymuconate cyclase-like protein-like protein [Hyaloscypha variabilis F]|uniref:3-carboxymuconate cyclase-like protein-like protein n=1 Tax=Hyaloscypha variabilis (strain UAMH 11265 / GT02V1 / F) TaxID=1149755 RepID=A0A2J6RBF5_HYAVF|nr:3-carboxymuconate cyclase-like protein-like protein [Hyaloscypha variabilis F]